MNVIKEKKEKKNEKRFSFSSLKNKLFYLIVFLSTVPLHAQSDLIPQGMMTFAESVRDVFTGDLVRTIFGCCFAGACIAYGYNKDNERMKGKLIALLIATGGLVLSQEIVDRIWNMG